MLHSSARQLGVMTDSHDGFRDLSAIGDMFKSSIAHMKVRECSYSNFAVQCASLYVDVDTFDAKPRVHYVQYRCEIIR